MKSFLPILLRTALVFLVSCGLQYLIPWFYLAPGGIAAGIFTLKTSNDRPLAIGLMVGSVLFGIFAYAMAQIYPVG